MQIAYYTAAGSPSYYAASVFRSFRLGRLLMSRIQSHGRCSISTGFQPIDEAVNYR